MAITLDDCGGNELLLRLALLDQALTGKDERWIKGQLHHCFGLDAERLILGDMYYLSDGGYSRVAWNQDSERLFLASESRVEVKKRWNQCVKAIEVAEAMLSAKQRTLE